jgi:hypothetical protein
MDTKNEVSIATFSALSILGSFFIAYGSTLPATNILLGRYSHEYLGEINIFTLIGIVLLPASLLLGVWVFTLPKKQTLNLNLSLSGGSLIGLDSS